jgi:hypothetical protein
MQVEPLTDEEAAELAALADGGNKRAQPVTRVRPGHADLAGALKYGFDDVRPILERASARETAARVAAGAGAAGVTVPCGAWPGGGALRVTAYDEHGTQRDQAWADAAVQIRAATCNGGADAALRFAPNPFRGTLRISGPAGTRVAIFDLSGRRRHAAVLDGGGRHLWNGLDDGGRALEPGIYLVRNSGLPHTTKLVKVE